MKMGHAPKADAEKPNDWDLGIAVRETENQFAKDSQLPMTETPNDLSLKTLVCLERKHHDNMLDEYSLYKNAINQIRAGFLRRPDNSPKELEDNRLQPPTPGTSSHKQNVNDGETLLVATDHQSHTEEMRELGPLQNVR